MTTKTWNGSADPLSTAADWTPTGVPAEGDVAVIAAGSPTATGTLNGVEIDIAGASAAGQPQLVATNLTLGALEQISLGESSGATAYATVQARGTTTSHGQIIAPGAGGTLTVALADLADATGRITTAGSLVNDGFISATGGTVRISGAAEAGLVNNATIGIGGGAEVDLGTAVTGTGRIVLQGAATLDVARSISAGQTISFAGSTATPERLRLDTPGAVNAALSGLGIGDTIDVPGTITGTVNGSTLSLQSGAAAVASLDIGAGYATSNFTFASDGAGGTLIGVVCYARGTRLLTAHGERPVEQLRPGDTVTTLSGADAAIRWVGRRRIDIVRHPQPDSVRPVRIAAHAFADGLPHRDLLVSPEHALFVDGVLIPAHRLLNDSSVTQDVPAAVEYFHVELDLHEVLLAEGLPAESYLDTGNRAMFANAPLVALHPEPAASGSPDALAPLVLEGPALDAVRARLAARAAALAEGRVA